MEGGKEGGWSPGHRTFPGGSGQPGSGGVRQAGQAQHPPLGEAGEAETVPAPSFNIQMTSDRRQMSLKRQG